MLLRNDEKGEDVRLSWEEDRTIIQRIRGGVAGEPVDHRRPSRLAAEVEALRLRDKLIREKYVVVDPNTARIPTPADRRTVPLFAHPPWLDPEGAIVEADRLLERGDTLAEVVLCDPDLIWKPDVLGRLFETRPLIALDLACGHVRGATIASHLEQRDLTLLLKKLFGIGARGYVLEVILQELAALEVARHLERLVFCGFGSIGSLPELDAFERLRRVAIMPSRHPHTGALHLDRVPLWLKRLDELEVDVALGGNGLFVEGAPLRRLSLSYVQAVHPSFSAMTPELWPNLRQLVLSDHYRPNQVVAELREAGLLGQLELLDLDGCSVGLEGAREIARELRAFPDLEVRAPRITDPIARKIAGLDPHPRQAAIDALAASPEIAEEARRFAFERGFRDSGGDELELWGYTEAGLTELRLSDGQTTCECSAEQPCKHALALMYRALEQDRARWLG